MLYKLTIISLAGIVCLLMINTPVLADAETYPACNGATGAAYGLCIAASHLKCGTEEEETTRACERIEENYLKLTGEIPPWLKNCPCWTTAILQSQGEFVRCGDEFDDAPEITAFTYATAGEFGVTGPIIGSPEVFQCGVYTAELGLVLFSPITEEESASCARQVMSLCPNPTN